MTRLKVKTNETLINGAYRHVGIVLAAPGRANSLEPVILGQLSDALDLARDRKAVFVTLRAEGRNFSTGGDVSSFLAASKAGDAERFSDQVVGLLQSIIHRMLALPAIIVTGAQGAITGGSAGLIFASDLVVLADNAFLQPYFSRVGFSPDGGWSALLPERLGAGRALQIQLTNARIKADEARRLGLAEQVTSEQTLNRSLDSLLAGLAEDHDPPAMLAAKRLIWNEARLGQIRTGLEAELTSFKQHIATPATRRGMQRFLDQLSEAV
ncbi:MAG: enoyl-CoA hydratase/isomerase family protein [Alphaproteobacteria bacterium]|nr:enoyl-CoA hydratase/isomerase family protein [Alphaproteobacteria bacterium]